MAPKKGSVNPKAEAARERKDAQKREAKEQESRRKEDDKWRDEGSTAAEKRAAAAEQRRLEEQKRKEAKRALLAQEAKSMSAVRLDHQAKVTQFQLRQQQEKLLKEQQDERRRKELEQQRFLDEREIEKHFVEGNRNREAADWKAEELELYGEAGFLDASSIDEALDVLKQKLSTTPSSSAEPVDRHPEKRLRAAWDAFYEANLPALKDEEKGLRLSQYREILWKRWQKSPENPVNRRDQLLKAQQDKKTRDGQ